MAERRDRPVWNRTRTQWVRSVALTGLIAAGATFALAGVGTLLLGTTLRFIGPYIGGSLRGPGYSLAGVVAVVVGLTAACAWGWIGRPRLLPAAAARTGGDTAGARLWTGVDGDADDGAGREGPVTS